MDNREKMLSGLPYDASKDGLYEDRLQCKKIIYRFNNTPPENYEESLELLRSLLGSAGERMYIEPPFRCDYGWNTYIGDNFYSNYNLIILDVGMVRIGSNVLIGPNVLISTAGHPVHHELRNTGLEYGQPITIGDNVWIGGNVTILPGVTIGEDCVIGAGSVVTRDIPPHSIAVGSPCKVLRPITDGDKKYYFKNREYHEGL